MARKSKYERAQAHKYGSPIQAPEPRNLCYTVEDVAWISGMHVDSIRKLEAHGKFPKRKRTKVGRVRYDKDKVHQWLREYGERILPRLLKTLPEGIWWQRRDTYLFFHAPRGFTFKTGDHYLDHFDISRLHSHLPSLTLRQCKDGPHCPVCRSVTEDNMKKYEWYQL